MRQLAKKILRLLIGTILTWEARLVLKKYQPRIVAVTGSVGKTSTKNAIYTVLQTRYRVWASDKSYNSEIGLPLAILGCASGWSNPVVWLKNIFEGLSLIFFRTAYPEWLVLELGVDRPGDIARPLRWLRPDIAVITRLPTLPAHLEFFTSAEAVAAEKLLLAKAVPQTGAVILNYDDPQIMAVSAELKAPIFSYGFNEGATLRAVHVQLYYPPDPNEWHWPAGITFKVDYQGHNVPLHLPGVFGAHQLSAILAALALGLSQKINLLELIAALSQWQPAPGRMQLLPGLKNTLLIDDTYNSSPAAAIAALETLGEIQTTGRRLAVLGDMMELGAKTVEAHRQVGVVVAQKAHELVTVGLRSKFIAEEAARRKLGKRKLHHFDEAREAGRFLQNYLEPGDVVLVKGSQSMRLERAVEEIMANPADKTKLLCRQEPEWQER